MTTLLKDAYNRQTVTELAEAISYASSAFNSNRFLQRVFSRDWQQLELKARMRRITECLGETLNLNYPKALAVLRVASSQRQFEVFIGLVFSDYVAVNGLADWQDSMDALADFTSLCSSEFAVRPFISNNPARMMTQMLEWCRSSDPHIRRLASEGCRPRLPWAEAIPAFKKDPSPIMPILEQLKNDSSEYVRRSVANNLNDISKDHPARVLQWSKAGYGNSRELDWVIKHGCRTLLKQAHPEALALFGYRPGVELRVSQFRIQKASVPIGGRLDFEFTVSGDPSLGKIRLEYRLGFQGKRGGVRSKVFKISEGVFNEPARQYQRAHSFQQRSTRTHYSGQHSLTLLVNGVEKGVAQFMVID